MSSAAVYPGCTIDRTYRQGDRGDGVHCIELALRAQKFQRSYVDGYFGSVTVTSVRNFQWAKRLLPMTGVVDERVAAALGIWQTPSTTTATTTPETPTTTALPTTTAPPVTTIPSVTTIPTVPPPTTTLPPPVDDWRDGAVAGCLPGHEFSRVDTNGAKLVALTFDDGPSPQWTESIMRDLERRSVRATFFVVGSMLRSRPEVVQAMIDRGFEVGNHSMTHAYRHSTIAAEIPLLNAQFMQRFGVRTPFFRAPGLASGRLISAAAEKAGMCIVRTNLIVGDTTLPRRTAAQLCATFRSQLKPGAIVLLHDGGGNRQTAAAMPCILDAALARGYRVVTLAELLAAGRAIR